MKIKKLWNSYVRKNKDSYSKACVDVARRVMELLDEDNTPLHEGYYPDIHTPHGMICKADNDINAGGITGAMAGCVATMVVLCHDRGDEFRVIWNGEYKGNGVVNPALYEINTD
jgi:hypothetical protein